MTQDEQLALIADFVNRRTWAVVGVSQDPTKFGNRVYQSLREAGYTVYAVHPKGGVLGGATVYPTLAELPEAPDVVDLVVPPAITEQVAEQAGQSGITRIWMQPGAESEAAIRYCAEHGIQVVHHACAMVHRRQWK